MKTLKLLRGILLLPFFILLVNAQSQNIVIGRIDSLHSQILNENRAVWIYKPANVLTNKTDNKKYPVIYLLDGSWHFTSTAGILEQLSYINGNTICPEMIIVGIPLNDRFRDLTPSCDSTLSKTSGGYEKFISFIKNELIPYVESNYPVAPYKMFIGHSLGGLAVINTLFNEPELFNSYVAIDPSMWWDNQKTLKEAKIILKNKKFDNRRLFLALANNMDKGMDTSSVRKDLSRRTLSIRTLLEFSDMLKSASTNHLDYRTKYYENESHGSVPLIATYDALHYIFDFYNLPLTKKDYADTSMNLAYRIADHYKTISDKMGYIINPSENLINTLGYSALAMNNLRQAEYFFSLNINNYPDSYNAIDSMGDYYLAAGNKKQASEMFKKSLSIKENPDIRKKLGNIDKK